MRPSAPGSYTNAAGQLLFRDGVVENWASQSGGRIDATFIDRKGNRIELPGVNISPLWTQHNAGFTMATGHIYLDPANGLVDIEHEYGHYLDQQQNGSLYYVFGVMPLSFINATFHGDTHQFYWTEIAADRQAVQFFGPNSAIAKSTYYPH